jgi:hypothetical protein
MSARPAEITLAGSSGRGVSVMRWLVDLAVSMTAIADPGGS